MHICKIQSKAGSFHKCSPLCQREVETTCCLRLFIKMNNAFPCNGYVLTFANKDLRFVIQLWPGPIVSNVYWAMLRELDINECWG